MLRDELLRSTLWPQPWYGRPPSGTWTYLERRKTATRIMALYRTCPSDGVVVCFDEFGPISLQPYPGHGYAQRKRPWRRRATYVRRGGIRYFFGL